MRTPTSEMAARIEKFEAQCKRLIEETFKSTPKCIAPKAQKKVKQRRGAMRN